MKIYVIIASRGRLKNGRWTQRYEPLGGDVCNTITTVTKDNLVLEIKKGKSNENSMRRTT